MPHAVGDSVIHVTYFDTGVVTDVAIPATPQVFLDQRQKHEEVDAAVIHSFPHRQSKRSGEFLYKIEAYLDRGGRRRLKMRAYRIREDGSFGGRVNVISRSNGRDI